MKQLWRGIVVSLAAIAARPEAAQQARTYLNPGRYVKVVMLPVEAPATGR